MDEIELGYIMYLNSTKSETGPTMSAHEIVNYELEFDLGKEISGLDTLPPLGIYFRPFTK